MIELARVYSCTNKGGRDTAVIFPHSSLTRLAVARVQIFYRPAHVLYAPLAPDARRVSHAHGPQLSLPA